MTAGGGVEGGWEIGDVSVTGGWAVYALTYHEQPRVDDWTQTRGSVGISYRFGTEPDVPDRIRQRS